MPQRSTFIDSIVTKPLVGNCFHFESASGDETLYFCMERSTAIAVASDILREARATRQGEVVAFKYG
jgi:hypothetical protein